MTRVLIIRPQPGAAVTLGSARSMGLDALATPLFEVRPLEWEAPPADRFDALLIGSANALRHGGEALERYSGMPAYTVGETSALAARDAGLEVMASGRRGLQAVLDAMGGAHPRLLRLSGRERVELSPPEGVTIDERAVYASEPLPFSAEALELLRDEKPVLVLLHSGEAACHFATLCEAAGIDRSRIALAAMGPRIAAQAGEGWRAVECAAQATDSALLALALQMCQDHAN